MAPLPGGARHRTGPRQGGLRRRRDHLRRRAADDAGLHHRHLRLRPADPADPRRAAQAVAGDRPPGRPDPFGLLPLRPPAERLAAARGHAAARRPPPLPRPAAAAARPRLRLRRERPRDPPPTAPSSIPARTAESAPDLVHQRRARLLHARGRARGRERPPGRRGRSDQRDLRSARRGGPGTARRRARARRGLLEPRRPGARVRDRRRGPRDLWCRRQRQRPGWPAVGARRRLGAARGRLVGGPDDLGDHGGERARRPRLAASRGLPRARRGDGRRSAHRPRDEPIAYAEPLLSTEYDEAGAHLRATLELWTEEDDYPERGGGRRVSGGTIATPYGQLAAARFAWSFRGTPAVGGYEILTP